MKTAMPTGFDSLWAFSHFMDWFRGISTGRLCYHTPILKPKYFSLSVEKESDYVELQK